MRAIARHGTRTPHVCTACEQPFVQAEFGVQEGTRWRVFLSCQSCGWSGQDLLDERTLERFERELDAERLLISRELDRLTQRNMHEYRDRFVTALMADAILPEDF
jgi:hypothetical protein